jgi:hypothetical protein
MAINRLNNWQPPAFGESGQPAANPRPGKPRRKGDAFPPPAAALDRLAEKLQPTEARLLLSPGADVNVFRTAFTEVWEKIPGADRNRMLRYWRDDDKNDYDRYRSIQTLPPNPRPHLLVLADNEIAEGDTECRLDGHILAFRASLTTSNRERLPAAIATALAKVHRIVTRATGLALLDFYKSFDAWDDKHPKATKAERSKTHESMVEEYMRDYRAKTSAVLQQWGFPLLKEGSV